MQHPPPHAPCTAPHAVASPTRVASPSELPLNEDVGPKDAPLLSLFPPENPPPAPGAPKLKVAIVGSGLAGLSTAVELLDQGYVCRGKTGGGGEGCDVKRGRIRKGRSVQQSTLVTVQFSCTHTHLYTNRKSNHVQ